MNIEKVYAECGGDYADVMDRLMTEARVEKFVTKFLDNKDFDMLKEAIEAKDVEGIFRNAHNLKGICLNLSFTELQKSSSTLCEMFRNGMPSEDYMPAWEQVIADRDRVINAIKANM